MHTVIRPTAAPRLMAPEKNGWFTDLKASASGAVGDISEYFCMPVTTRVTAT